MYGKLKPKLINKELVERGKWYQPYIHSVPENFNFAQKTWYRNFSLDRSLTDLRGYVQTTMQQLIAYYKRREQDLMQFLGYKGDHKSFQKDAQNLLSKFSAEYLAGRTGRYKIIDSLYQGLKGIENFQENIKSNQKKYLENILNAQLRKAGMNLRTKAAQQRKKQTFVIINQIESLLDELSKKAGINNPHALIDQILQMIANGDDFSNLTPELLGFISLLQKELKLLLELLKTLSSITRAERVKGGAKVLTPVQQYANALGLFNEDLTGEIMQNILEESSRMGANLFSKSLGKKFNFTYRVTGREDVPIDVADTTVTIQNKQTGEAFNFGVDVKFHINSNYKNNRKYERGELKKQVSEVFDIPAPEEIAAMLYLMTNSYFFGAEAEGNWYNRFLGGHGGEIFQLFNLVIGLYGLLPSGAMLGNVGLHNISFIVRSDTRMFVTINQNAYLMTEFLETVNETLFNTAVMGKPIRDLKANFETIMSEIRAAAGGEITKSIPAQGLYEQKMNYIRDRFASGSLVSYNGLKNNITDKIIDQKLYGWKYRVERFKYQL